MENILPKRHLEFAHFVHFMSTWMCREENDMRHLRLGQAFHQWFGLHKSTWFKNEYDRLYQMDGEKAEKYIHELFEFI